MSPKSTFFCRVVSVLGITCALFCLWYIAVVSYGVETRIKRAHSPQSVMAWHVFLSTIAALIALGIASGSVGLARLRIRGARLLTISSTIPIPLLLLISLSWHLPAGESIAAATGIGLGGLVPILYSLLPLWAGLVWRFAFRSSQIPQISNLPTTTKG